MVRNTNSLKGFFFLYPSSEEKEELMRESGGEAGQGGGVSEEDSMKFTLSVTSLFRGLSVILMAPY